MISAEGVRYTDRSVWLSAFRKCMGRVPSDEKIPDDMSDEDKCTVCTAGSILPVYSSTTAVHGFEYYL